MHFTDNETRSLIAILEAAAVGRLTVNQQATAAGLAARFRRQDAAPDDGQTPEEPTPADTPLRLDVAAIFAKRRAVVEQAMAANSAARLGARRE